MKKHIKQWRLEEEKKSIFQLFPPEIRQKIKGLA